MIFCIEPETKCLVANLPHVGGQHVFDCKLNACANAACRCRTTTLTMRPRAPSPSAQRNVRIDLAISAVDETFRERASPEDSTFAEKIVAAMDEADFDLLARLHAALKNRICEEAKPSDVEAHFDYTEIDTSSALQAYNHVLPFADTFRVLIGDTEFLVLDQYCVRGGCQCTDAHLSLLPFRDDNAAVDSIGAVAVDYATASWTAVPAEPLPCAVADFRRLLESANSNLYIVLRARHTRLCAIYAHCRQRDLKEKNTAMRASSVGRSDPCSCGSGKKFKMCCMGKPESPPKASAANLYTSTLVSLTRSPRSS